MRREDMADLTLFLAVVDEGSFTRAARKLGVSQSALSHSVRRLEERLSLRLLTRTTRSVAPTEAGQRMLDALRPAIDSVDSALSSLTELRARPAGMIRLTTSEHGARRVVWPAVSRLLKEYPDIQVELDVEASLTDIVAGRFDAGVRLGERLEQDMVAVRIGPRLRMAAVGSPDYFAQSGMPLSPHDLGGHKCINLRLASAGGLYIWEFERHGRELKVKVEGQLVLNHTGLIVEAAVGGHGIAYLLEDEVSPMIAAGKLVRVLDDWCEPFDGYHLYYPSRRQPSQAFSLLLDALRAGR